MRLLIVEDEEILAENLKKVLELKGYAVDWLADAEKAHSRITLYHKDYDLVLLDLTLPNMSGMTLIKKLREGGITTPIIILTGRSETEKKVELLNSGADDYVVKPFSSEELIARISSVMRRPKKAEPVVHTAGNITIDTASHRVLIDGAEVPVTLKEYSLLECFVRAPGKVLTREELSNQVWDFNSFLGSNVLDVHMKNLRKKLPQSDGSSRFETIRGVGYRLVN